MSKTNTEYSITLFRTPSRRFSFLWRFSDPIITPEYRLFALFGVPFFSIALLEYNKCQYLKK